MNPAHIGALLTTIVAVSLALLYVLAVGRV
jgi:hypothetical protein